MLHRVWRLSNQDIGSKQRRIMLTTGIFLLGCVGVAGGIFQYVNHAEQAATQQASLAYSGLLEQYREKKADKGAAFIKEAEHLVQQYPKTIYANMTRLMLAKAAHQSNHLLAAKAYLEAILKNKKGKPLDHIARLRLARLLAAEARHEEALSMLSVDETGVFDPLYQMGKGDIYLAMTRVEEANEAYMAAMASSPEEQADVWLKMKQADIGGQG